MPDTKQILEDITNSEELDTGAKLVLLLSMLKLEPVIEALKVQGIMQSVEMVPPNPCAELCYWMIKIARPELLTK